jgi:ATP-dependent Clp protease ATP-binding subunit ClpC
MARRRSHRPEPGPGGAAPGDDVVAFVRAAARAVAARLDDYPAVDDLADDADFLQGSRCLERNDVRLETVERLARSSNAIVAAMADRALARRDAVSGTWLDWAFRRLKHAYAGELFFLVEAIERHAEPPLLSRVLANADTDWSWGWCFGVITTFVERRVRAGERPTVADFDVIDLDDEELVASVVAELDGVLPPESVRDFDEWRRRRTELRFFQSLGRVWKPGDEPHPLTTVGGRAAVVAALDATLRKPSGPSALLVGEHGVGKTAVLREVLGPLHRDGWFIFEATATELMAGQTYIGQLEARLREIAERAKGGRVLWVMPAFAEAISAGQHSRSPVGALDMLFPYLEAGQIRIVGELDPAAYDLAIKQRPRLASAFEALRLEPLTADEALAVAKDWRERAGIEVDDVTIADTFDLAAHYLPGVAAPGGPLRLLKATAAHVQGEGGHGVRTGDVLETLSEATGLPLHVVDPQAPLDLAEVRGFFSSRVIGQDEAVDCLVERIALVKAGLTDPTRPLGVFLFVGPTGTGKTELAKALAEFLFGSQDRLVRLDMSEFQTADSLERLLGDPAEQAEGAALIASVRSNPFAVVLLDEFEKAHRNIWSVFLQLFDDGRLTDRRGRTADFRQCVVILTSNLGAAVERGTRLGFGTDSSSRFRRETVERGVSKVFRPEFVNRIDRIVVFRPFERDQVRALLERELARVLERRGFRGRPWAVEWDESALEFLAEKGFSVELGARPLKRAIEHYLLAPLAGAIVSRSFPEGDQFLFVTARDDRIEVTFVDPDAEEAEAEPEAAADETPPAEPPRLEQLVLEPSGGPGETAFLQAETERLRRVIEGDRWLGLKERDLETMRDEAFWQSPERFAVLARIEYVDRVQAAFRTAEKLLERLLQQRRNGRRSARNVVELLAERLYLLDRACAAGSASDPSDAFLEIRASTVDRAEADFAVQLREMYEAWARRRGMRVARIHAEGSHVLAVSGIGAYQILAPETGLHVLESPHDDSPHGDRSFARVAAQVAVAPSLPASPDTEVAESARHALEALPPSTTIVRRYRTRPSPLVRDSVRAWRTGRLDRVLAGEFDVIIDR